MSGNPDRERGLRSIAWIGLDSKRIGDGLDGRIRAGLIRGRFSQSGFRALSNVMIAGCRNRIRLSIGLGISQQYA